MIEIKVPTVGESISEVTLLKWNKKDGDYVERDEVIAELESEKATFEVNAEKAGIIKLASIKEGDTIKIGDLLASIDDSAAKPESGVGNQEPVAKPASNGKPAEEKKETKSKKKELVKEESKTPVVTFSDDIPADETSIKASPVASAIIADKKVDPKTVTATGIQGKILKEDVLAALSNPGKKTFDGAPLFSRNVRTEKMSNLRKTISRRLVEAKNSTAMLTTFNEVDMGIIMAIRTKYKDKFKEIHGVGLGFMSFFAKACAVALAEWPSVNAFIDGDQVMYHDYADISIAVSTPRGLTVPVIRNVESLSMADIEKKVIEVAAKAKDSKLTAEELTGGTFTITNGGVFGSLMSTPIINIPQSAILGMHKIQERPVAVNGQVVIKSMMYLALSYDHRIIDGRESVSFLIRVKELLENPEQLLMGKDPVKTLLEL
ncbi:MAG TPA: 2-oxoglutarate dehydrogenase complex dihydrolipoyllysine-residue succinyltransferase [Chitinophagaceae bacterium]|nr:2-oxoglutarate dehydrogenase complex dihydrolipoyllysine-residue succinyltransferase [Chitinophagaceae bacterium]